MNRMKDLFWMAVIVLFAAFSSCSDDKNDGTDEGVADTYPNQNFYFAFHFQTKNTQLQYGTQNGRTGRLMGLCSL